MTNFETMSGNESIESIEKLMSEYGEIVTNLERATEIFERSKDKGVTSPEFIGALEDQENLVAALDAMHDKIKDRTILKGTAFGKNDLGRIN